ncbi:hypothetical protein ACHAWO_012729 [Cyclotella atomus]|uniref:Uncharacterized protein n=1 Tax=Cyclotella atomus TaxID=382360 RepID=A0ABD3QAH7_9STRA
MTRYGSTTLGLAGNRPIGGGQTPQMRWPDGKTQGESMDLVREIDERYNSGLLYPDAIKRLRLSTKHEIQEYIPIEITSIFTSCILVWSGAESRVEEREFESVLRKTDRIAVRDSAAQLPCLRDGLDPKDASAYPHLAALVRGKWKRKYPHMHVELEAIQARGEKFL